MATSTVIPDDIKTLKSDVSKLKNDQGSYATKLYVDSKDEIVGDWSVSWYQQVLPTSGAIFGRKLRSTHRTAGVEDAYYRTIPQKMDRQSVTQWRALT